MRTSRILVVSLLALPLGGCLGVTLPPQPLPDWAVNPQAQYDEPRAQPAARVTDTKPFAPGWDSLESERDDSLRRTLNICRGC
jgi:hypothetical protein